MIFRHKNTFKGTVRKKMGFSIFSEFFFCCNFLLFFVVSLAKKASESLTKQNKNKNATTKKSTSVSEREIVALFEKNPLKSISKIAIELHLKSNILVLMLVVSFE